MKELNITYTGGYPTYPEELQFGDITIITEKSKIYELFKQKIDLGILETEMLKEEQVECPLTHEFAEGVYMRTMKTPAGTLLLGKRHKHAICNILLKGKVSIYMGEGNEVLTLEAPFMFTSKPGDRKLGYTHTEMIFTTIHPNPSDKRNVHELEKEIIWLEDEYKETVKRLNMEDEQ